MILVAVLIVALAWIRNNNNTSLVCFENIIADSPWHLEDENSPAEAWTDFSDLFILHDKDLVRITYDLNGLMAQEGERKNDSTVVFTQRDSWYGVTLVDPKYGGKNKSDGKQTVYIPLTEFVELPNADRNIIGGAPLNLDVAVSSIRARFWHRDHFVVEITDIAFCTYQD